MPNFPRQNKLIDSVYHRFKTNIYINLEHKKLKTQHVLATGEHHAKSLYK